MVVILAKLPNFDNTNVHVELTQSGPPPWPWQQMSSNSNASAQLVERDHVPFMQATLGEEELGEEELGDSGHGPELRREGLRGRGGEWSLGRLAAGFAERCAQGNERLVAFDFKCVKMLLFIMRRTFVVMRRDVARRMVVVTLFWE